MSNNNGNFTPSTWEEIERLIFSMAEKKFQSEMFDKDLATLRAHEFAADIVRVICSTIGPKDIYVPRIARHQRDARDQSIKSAYSGQCHTIAAQASLSIRQVRRIVSKK